MRLGVLTLNVANPSAARAERQLAWLSERSEQVLVLTETSPGAGSRLLLDRLAAAGTWRPFQRTRRGSPTFTETTRMTSSSRTRPSRA